MKRLNNKGFTLIEIIGAVVILSILTLITTAAFLSYSDWSKKKALDTMARSASVAAEQYIMDFSAAVVPEDEALRAESYDRGVKLKTLVDNSNTKINTIIDDNLLMTGLLYAGLVDVR